MPSKLLLSAAIPCALALAGCASQTLPTPVPQPYPVNYRQIAANAVAALPKADRFKSALISDLQPSVAPQPADWFACLRLSDGGFIAVFYGDEKITDMRRSIGFDRCDRATNYSPLPRPEPPKKPRST
ncbi:MAG: hypothetical protein Q8M26_11825 [Pseudolabrys sp.]|nr:hypothetical protein [Pseudolabrys sp.]